jgi:hypothetical protein
LSSKPALEYAWGFAFFTNEKEEDNDGEEVDEEGGGEAESLKRADSVLFETACFFINSCIRT